MSLDVIANKTMLATVATFVTATGTLANEITTLYVHGQIPRSLRA